MGFRVEMLVELSNGKNTKNTNWPSVGYICHRGAAMQYPDGKYGSDGRSRQPYKSASWPAGRRRANKAHGYCIIYTG